MIDIEALFRFVPAGWHFVRLEHFPGNGIFPRRFEVFLAGPNRAEVIETGLSVEEAFTAAVNSAEACAA